MLRIEHRRTIINTLAAMVAVFTPRAGAGAALWMCLGLAGAAFAADPALAPPVNPAVAATEAAWRTVSDRWYVVELSGTKAGWLNELVQSDGARFRTKSETRMTMGRGAPTAIEVKMRSEFLETSKGEPISVHVQQDLATQSMDSLWTFEPDHVKIASRQGAKEITSTQPLPEGAWLTPVAAQQYWKERSSAGAKEISYRTLVPDEGAQPVTVTSVRTGEGQYELDGRTISVTIWKTTTTNLPVATEKYSSDGVRVSIEISAGLKMVMRLAQKEDALRQAAGAAPDLMASTFVRPDRPIERAMRSTRAVYRITMKDGSRLDLPTAGAQAVKLDESGTSATITVDLDAPHLASESEIADAGHVESSLVVDAGDELVMKLAASAVRAAGDDSLARAEAIRVHVHRYISAKGMDTAFASASETARMRTGDCSEHAVLLCAMLRAQKIPARVATGLVYVDRFAGQEHIFGWHMWTQALIEGRWIDLDATLPRRYHAAHILAATSPLTEGSMTSSLSSLLSLIGNIEIEVVEVSYGKVDGGN